MTREEKAKAYEETMDRAKKELDTCGSQDCDAARQIFRLFPELKESEDEGIRKSLIDMLKNDKKCYLKEIAWLEEQGQHKKFRDSIQVGDKVTRNEDGVLVNLSQLNRVAKKDEKQGKQKPVELDDTNAKEMFIKALERVEEQNNKGYKLTDCDKNSWWEDFKAYTLCTIKQNLAWSEEDEAILEKCIGAVKVSCYSYSFKSKAENWLQSLKDRYTWKPSDEQMNALWSATEKYLESDNENVRKLRGGVLESLYEDLKKLREK